MDRDPFDLNLHTMRVVGIGRQVDHLAVDLDEKTALGTPTKEAKGVPLAAHVSLKELLVLL